MKRVLAMGPAVVPFAALLLVACLWTALALPDDPGLASELVLHVGLLAALLAAAALAIWKPAARFVPFVLCLVYISLLYTTLGPLSLALHGGVGVDAALASMDRVLFGWMAGGLEPTFVAATWVRPWRTELLSAVYILFILYMYLSVITAFLAFEGAERDEFVLGMTLNWSLGFLGYLVFPAQGPIAWHAADYTTAISGGPIFATLMDGFQTAGGAMGAFPSLHVGGAFFFCAFDWRRRPFRGMTYSPIVILIAISTVYLRFHYVVDWVGGIALASFSLWAAPHLVRRWRLAELGEGAAVDPPTGASQ